MNKHLTFKKIIDMQMQFDNQHGFTIDKSSYENKYNQITKDLVGLYGEIGEFSNIVKKVNLLLDYKKVLQNNEITSKEDDLREELVDSFIYFIRLASALNLDLETELLKKLGKNKEKYSTYER